MGMDLMKAFADMADVLAFLPGANELAAVNVLPNQEPLKKGIATSVVATTLRRVNLNLIPAHFGDLPPIDASDDDCSP